MSSVAGLRLPVVGGSVRRIEDKRILGHINISKSAPILTIGDGESSDAFDFFSASELISDDAEHPTIFQNLTTQVLPADKQINIPGFGRNPMGYEFSYSALTEAVGFITHGKFVGTMRMSYDFCLSNMIPLLRQVLTARFGDIPDRGQMNLVGRFEVSLLPDLDNETNQEYCVR